MRLITTIATIYTLSLIVFPMNNAQAGIIAELDDFEPGELKSIGVELSQGGKFQIEAVGIRANWDDDDLIAYAWIIDNKTRELVWSMRDRDTDRVRRGQPLRSQNDLINLEKGKYEIYYYSGNRYGGIKINFNFNFDDDDDDDGYDDRRRRSNLFDKLGDFFDGGSKNRRTIRKYLRDCYVRLSSESASSSSVKTFKVSGDLPGALLRKNRLGDSEYVKWGFKLDKAMNLRIYTVFEFPRGNRSPVDYGWIVDADNRERVWEIDRWDTERAGGGRKNRMYDREVELPAGNYILHFVTDDSHSFERFNTNPPFDPFNWGITVLPGSGFQKSAFHEYEPPSRGKALIDFSRARDDDYFEQAFRLTKPVTLHIYAIGEYASNDFVDFGWIEDVSSHRTVWEMNKRNTEYAGGGRKNRMFDGPIDLPAGDYVAYYLTDGSHSYRDWNTSPPFEPSAWGMTISASAGSNASHFSKIQMSDITSNSEVLVALTKVRDNQRRRAKFTLDKRSTIRIYALGEGTGRDMADYAWIIDDETGRDVWEMRYRQTRHAGGAKKNRIIDDEVTLDAGTYVVFYVTDGSHAFNHWNATRPRDFRNWGVTISLADR